MLRAAVFTLLVASLLAGSLRAQRAGAASRGSPAGRSGFVEQRSFSNGFFPGRGSRNRFFSSRFRSRRGGFGDAYFFPDYDSFWYEQPYAEATTGPAPVVIVQQRDEGQLRTPETPPSKPQVIEIPGAANSTAAKALPPTIFILTSGERLETRRFMLTASNLSLSVDRHQRTIPLDMLDLDATITANRERCIDLRIPADRNEIFLGF